MTQDSSQNRRWHPAPFFRQTQIGVRASLIASVLGPEQATKPQPKKAKKRGSPQTKGDDNLILEIRRLYEQCDMKPAEISRHMSTMGHNVSTSRAHQITQYQTRSNLIPTPGAEPYITKAAT